MAKKRKYSFNYSDYIDLLTIKDLLIESNFFIQNIESLR